MVWARFCVCVGESTRTQALQSGEPSDISGWAERVTAYPTWCWRRNWNKDPENLRFREVEAAFLVACDSTGRAEMCGEDSLRSESI